MKLKKGNPQRKIKIKSWFFEKINSKTGNSLTRLIKEKRRHTNY